MRPQHVDLCDAHCTLIEWAITDRHGISNREYAVNVRIHLARGPSTPLAARLSFTDLAELGGGGD